MLDKAHNPHFKKVHAPWLLDKTTFLDEMINVKHIFLNVLNTTIMQKRSKNTL